MRDEHRLNLTWFDPEAADLHLVINSAQELASSPPVDGFFGEVVLAAARRL
jgi:hypothetical protein